jgi:hypothetical protein
VVVEVEDEGGLRPERHVGHAELPRQRGRPDEEGVGDEAGGSGLGHDAAEQVLGVGGEHVQEALHVLVVVQRPVEAQREAVAHQLVPHVQLRGRAHHAGEDVFLAAAGARADLAVDRLRVDEGHREAALREAQRQVHRRDDVALQRVRNHHGVRLSATVARAGGAVCCHDGLSRARVPSPSLCLYLCSLVCVRELSQRITGVAATIDIQKARRVEWSPACAGTMPGCT